MSEWISTPESSNVNGFSYDSVSQILTVEFKSGVRYNYYDVPSHVYEGLKTAGSKGSYLSNNIKNIYRYARL